MAEEALQSSRQRGERGYEAWALYVRGEIEAAGGDVTAGEASRRAAAALAAELAMQPLLARCRRVGERIP